jgi:hypothetical protein
MLKLFIEYLHYARVKLKLNRKSELLRILNKQSPLSILEIGVDEGENTIRLISELSKKVPISKIRYMGIDLFGLMNPEIAKNEASQIPKSKIDIEIFLKKISCMNSYIGGSINLVTNLKNISSSLIGMETLEIVRSNIKESDTNLNNLQKKLIYKFWSSMVDN